MAASCLSKGLPFAFTLRLPSLPSHVHSPFLYIASQNSEEANLGSRRVRLKYGPDVSRNVICAAGIQRVLHGHPFGCAFPVPYATLIDTPA
jgi:hypothetical protein